MKLPFYLLEDGESSEENDGVVYSTSTADRALLIKKTLGDGFALYGFENKIIAKFLTKSRIYHIQQSWHMRQYTQEDIDNYNYVSMSPYAANGGEAAFQVTDIDLESKTVEIEIIDKSVTISGSVGFTFICIKDKGANTMKAVGVVAAYFEDK